MLSKIAVIGGTVAAKLVAANVQNTPTCDPVVVQWVYEELVNGQKLTDIINSTHENIKYLPGVKLPANIRAEPDLLKATKDATLIVFVLPHQFLPRVLGQLKGTLRKDACAISLIKGMEDTGCGLNLISDDIIEALSIDVSVLSGANIASSIAAEEYSESTIGYTSLPNALLWKSLFQTPYFRINLINDPAGVQLCGALKNVISIASGLADGLGLGTNTKAAVIRIGLSEMRAFAKMFFKGVRDDTFFESCGVADGKSNSRWLMKVLTSCMGGRNSRVAEARVLTGKTFEVLECEMLNGQMLQGTLTARDVHTMLKRVGKQSEFPLFTAVYRIVYENVEPDQLINLLHQDQ